MDINELKAEHRLIDLFIQLCEIPSPPLKEGAVAEKIMSIFQENNISAEFDAYKNIIARLPGKGKYKDVQPLMLSAHMDVVGGSEAVNPRLSADGKYIETDKTRTLGADDKAGIAAILDLAINLANPENKTEHGSIEITFTRDEEKGMTGIRSLHTFKLSSKYAIIADGETLGELDAEGAGFTNVYVKVHSGKGGHSGINIHEEERVSAIKVLAEFASKIPQGVYKPHPKKGVITSINAGVCMGGSADIFMSEAIKEGYELAQQGKPIPKKYSASKIMDTASHSAALNTITSEAQIAYSIRSSEPENEQQLINLIKTEAEALNNKYKGLIRVDVEVKLHLQPFIKNHDDFLTKVIMKTGKKYNITAYPASFHAGAETHILANEKQNRHGEAFIPVIIGVADLENIHSADEKIDWQSFLIGRKWLEDIVIQFAEDSLAK